MKITTDSYFTHECEQLEKYTHAISNANNT